MASFSSSLAQRLSQRFTGHSRWVVLAMLLALHAALVSEPGEVFQRIWLLVHLGFFLLWQPFYAAEQELEVLSVVSLVVLTALTLYFLAGWTIVMWLLLLLGILGGRVFTVHAPGHNRFYLAAFAYVLVMLLVWAVPVLVLGERNMPSLVTTFARVVMPMTLLLLVLLPLGPALPSAGQVFDFFYAVLVFQLGVVLVLGSLALMRFTANNYAASVALTVMGFGLALFMFALLWNPMRGFGGLRTYFSRYLLSVGMPFELWVRRIAELAETESDSSRFVDLALKEVQRFPWVRGGEWHSIDGDGQFGQTAGHASRFSAHGLEVVFHTEIELSPTLLLHMRLLAQVVGEFYEGKRRESALRRAAYLQAVHETGARLTHDVKNLLQSLYALMSMAPRDSSDGYAGLLQRQLPQLTRRLYATIEKLRAPEFATSEAPVPASAWWGDLERRMHDSGIALTAAIEGETQVPGSLFDSFVENALENARAKSALETGVRIAIGLECDGERTALWVADTGSAVPQPIAKRLFREPIERGAGLGIGLFHAARLARQAGFELVLAANRDGEVRFGLVRPAPGSGHG